MTRRATDLIDPDDESWMTGEGLLEPDKNDAVAKRTGPLSIRLRIGNSRREIEVNLARPVYLGRLDPNSDVFPDVDLTPDGGLKQGVSRRHARILNRDGAVVIEDLGSTNGTFVNDKHLAPYVRHLLNHGDQVRIGKLTIAVEFR